ncbi:hypothetical protein [Lactococcus termiticola]|uniref:DUF4190 domain-containing protein n=1 Tax=Lactococcus termiticola TaxID=2169526 RepID=A0A2R5HES4_9LACT|nr:hypothetical protein [Lactococcus termiticola]GBG96336.1 hypothetical protein NtB2_00447 [Lactococcus termiticola]
MTEQSNKRRTARQAWSPTREKLIGISIASVLLGAFSWLYFWSHFFALVSAVLGLGMGLAGLIINRRNKNALALMGTVFSSLGLILALVLMFLPSSSPKTVKQQAKHVQTDSSSRLLPKQAAGDNLGPGYGSAFSWTINDFLQLKIGNEEGKDGEELTSLVAKYGQVQSSSDTQNGNELPLKYLSYSEDVDDTRRQRRVDLEFIQQGDASYRLRKATAYHLGKADNEITGLENPFSQLNYQQLKAGDFDTGDSGSTMKDCFALFGYPKSIEISHFRNPNAKGKRVQGYEAKVIYEDLQVPINRVELDFEQLAGGKFLLAKKEVFKE